MSTTLGNKVEADYNEQCGNGKAVALVKWLAIVVISIALRAEATVYYVDSGAGSDSNSGTSTTSPWKHLPGDPNATGNPANATIGADTIYLKGGITYTLSSAITIDSGSYTSAGGRIIGGSAVGFGSGRPVITGGAQWMIISQDNITLRGLEFSTASGGGNDGALQLKGDGIYVDSCKIHDSSPAAHQDTVEVDGNNNTVTNCIVYNATQKCIEVYGSTSAYNAAGYHNLIINNICYNASDHCIVISAVGNTVTGNIVSNAAPSPNIDGQPSTSPGYGIKLSSSSGSGPCSTNLIYNNVVSHCQWSLIFDNVGPYTMNDNKVFNNTFVNSGINAGNADGNIALNGQQNNFQIRNNIFYGIPSFGWAAAVRNLTSSLGVNNIFSHNLFGDPSVTVTALNGGGAGNVSLANYADNGSTSPDLRFLNTGGGSSFGSSANQFFNVDPLFNSYTSDLTLQSSSPVKAAGINLSAYFTTDILGNPRSNWSLGAYEYGAGGVVVPQPPTGLHVIAGP